MRDRGIEQPLDLASHMRLAEDPHQLGDDRLGRHVVGFEHAGSALEMIAHLIDAQIAALALHLRGHDDRFAALGRIGDAFQKTARSGHAAHTVALYDACVAFG